mmetsp:Transcript_25308/g.70897  ORF Transcript_25308/g.70897 Transcript_25308/m.70897 type:complete len:225 (+) Transcript_25308:864-1538(+)
MYWSFIDLEPPWAVSILPVSEQVRPSIRRMALSLQDAAKLSPRTSQMMSWARSGKSLYVLTHSDASTSQTLMERSAEHDSSVLEAVGWYLRSWTFLACPSRSSMESFKSSPCLAIPLSSVGSQSSGMDQILMVVSSEAVAIMESSNGENSISNTEPVCPCTIWDVPFSKRPGRSWRPTKTGPPPPAKAVAQYLVEAFTYCCSPVEVESRKSVCNCSCLGWSQKT